MELFGLVLVGLIYLTIGCMIETLTRPIDGKFSFKIIFGWPILLTMVLIYEIHNKRK